MHKVCPQLKLIYNSSETDVLDWELGLESASFPWVQRLNISNAAFGWSIGTMWPALCTYEHKSLDKRTTNISWKIAYGALRILRWASKYTYFEER